VLEHGGIRAQVVVGHLSEAAGQALIEIRPCNGSFAGSALR
jgi:hypothetical protein